MWNLRVIIIKLEWGLVFKFLSHSGYALLTTYFPWTPPKVSNTETIFFGVEILRIELALFIRKFSFHSSLFLRHRHIDPMLSFHWGLFHGYFTPGLTLSFLRQRRRHHIGNPIHNRLFNLIIIFHRSLPMSMIIIIIQIMLL